MKNDLNIQHKIVLIACTFLLITFVLTVYSPTGLAKTNEDRIWTVEGEVENSIEKDFTEEIITTETEFVTEFELEDNLNLEIGLTNEYETDGESAWEAEIDLEITPKFKKKDLELYLETDLDDTSYNESLLGIEGSLGETDYDLGLDLNQDEKEIYLELYRWFNSGVSVRGNLVLGNGPEFKTGTVRFRGVRLTLNEVAWDLSSSWLVACCSGQYRC